MNKKNFQIFFASLILSLFICSGMINCVIGFYFSTQMRVGLFLMALIWIIALIYWLVYVRKFSKNDYFLIIYLAIVFAISFAKGGVYTFTLLLSFVEYGLLGILISRFEYDKSKVVLFVSVLLIVFFLPSLAIFNSSTSNQYTNDINMEITYSYLPTLFVSIYGAFFVKYNRLVKGLSVLCAFYVLFDFLTRGTRGAWICVALFVVSLFLLSRKISKQGKITIVAVLSVFAIFIALNFNFLLTSLDSYLESRGVSVYFVDKTKELLSSSSDFSNGRKLIYQTAFGDFLKKPFFGNGVGLFHDQYPDMNYQHNIVLQILNENGFLLGLPLLFILFALLYTILFDRKAKGASNFGLLVVISAFSLPMLFISSQFWGERLFWLLVGTVINRSETLYENRNNNLSKSV